MWATFIATLGSWYYLAIVAAEGTDKSIQRAYSQAEIPACQVMRARDQIRGKSSQFGNYDDFLYHSPIKSFTRRNPLHYKTIAKAATPAITIPPTPAFSIETAAPLLVAAEPADVVVEASVVSFGCFVEVATAVFTPVPFVQIPEAGSGAELENVISAQLKSPPSGSPFVTT